MKVAELTAIGPAETVVRCAQMDEPPPPGPGEVTIDIHACPINPADILGFEGNYASVPETPCRIGIEGAGRVTAVGEDVTDLEPGDPVMSLARANWAERLTLPAEQVVKLPAGIDIEQAAMLKVNAATAMLMLRDYVTLRPGDWAIQDAANSGVGTDLIKLARAQGFKTVNVVRRAELIEPLKALGADVVVVDGPDLAERVRAETGGAEIHLAVDAVGGAIIQRLAECLTEGGTIVNYGLLSGEPCQIEAHQLVFRDVRLVGFWLAKLMRGMSREEIAALYRELVGHMMDGTLRVAIEARYPLDRISEALAHAKRGSRGGKILLTPNG
jgi:trans-2-enoyl-CoA reductase